MKNGTNNNKYYFTGQIILTSALHIGGGTINVLNTNNPVVRTPAMIPFIPGSSLKGVFRSYVDKVVTGIKSISSCQLKEKNKEDKNGKNPKECYSVSDGLQEWKKKKENKFTEDALAAELEENLCDVCKTFGSPWRASRVFFTDSYLAVPSEITQVRDGVVIDRDSETGVEGLKYDFEVVPVGSAFSFSLSLENATPVDLGIIALGLNEMRSGFMQIGGNISRGTGNFILEDLKGYEAILSDMQQLKKYVRNKKKEEKMTLLDIDSFLEKKIDYLFGEEEAAC